LRPQNWLQSLNCAVEGILLAARSQRNMRAHLLAGVLVVLAGWLGGVSTEDLGLLILAIGLVLSAEVMNSAVEAVVDLLSPEFAERARHAKDMAAGAVLTASFGAAFLGLLVFYPLARRLIAGGLDRVSASPLPLALAVLGLTLVATVFLKARAGVGTPLHGGMPSGHSAVAFAVWGLLSLLTRNPLVVVLVLVLALMVSHSRTLMGIHSLLEVLLGAVLGASVSLVAYRVFLLVTG